MTDTVIEFAVDEEQAEVFEDVRVSFPSDGIVVETAELEPGTYRLVREEVDE